MNQGLRKSLALVTAVNLVFSAGVTAVALPGNGPHVTNSGVVDTGVVDTGVVDSWKPVINSDLPATVQGDNGASITLSITAHSPIDSGTLSYEWYHNDQPLSGADAAEYSISSLGKADAGVYYVVVKNTYLDSYATTTSAHSSVFITVDGATLSGTAKVGELLTATASPADAEVTYQWCVADDPLDIPQSIEGATDRTYSPVAADEGKYISVMVTGNENAFYMGNALSQASEKVLPVTQNIPVTGVEILSPSNVQVGQTLTTALTPADAKVTYQWQRAQAGTDAFTDIPGETNSSYTPLEGDVGMVLRVKVTGDANEHYTGTSTSAATSPVAAAPVSQVDKSLLQDAVASAKTNLNTAVVNTSASNVAVGTKWVTQSERDVYVTAIEVANTVLLSTDATQGEVDDAVQSLGNATAIFNSVKKDGAKSSGSGSGSGGSSGSSDDSSSSSQSSSTPATTPSISTAEAAKAATESVNAAIKEAVSAGTGSANVAVNFQNVKEVSPDTFATIAQAVENGAQAVKVTASVHLDTVVNGQITARLYIDPVAAAKLSEPINTTVDVSANSQVNTSVTNLFDQYFTNELQVATFAQKGDFGVPVSVALKVDLSGLKADSLKFYTYNQDTNTFREIANPGYYIDTAGYVHFTTTSGGSVLITDKPLTHK